MESLPKQITHKDFLMFVVDVLRYDIENLSSILKLLNNEGSIGWRRFWDRDFTEADVIPALSELATRQMVRILKEDQFSHDLVVAAQAELYQQGNSCIWFELTQEGLQAWKSWCPPSLPAGS